MKKIILLVVVTVMCICIAGCKDKNVDPTMAPKNAMSKALALLQQHDYDSYIKTLDISCDMDSLHEQLMLMMICQHQQREEEKSGEVSYYRVFDAKMVSDTVCTVFYETVFADSTKDVSSQKMVMTGGDWKIRMRN